MEYTWRAPLGGGCFLCEVGFNFPRIGSNESASNAGDTGLIPGSGRSLREGNGYPLQYSCLENSVDRRAWRAVVNGVAELETLEWPTLSISLSLSKDKSVPFTLNAFSRLFTINSICNVELQWFVCTSIPPAESESYSSFPPTGAHQRVRYAGGAQFMLTKRNCKVLNKRDIIHQHLLNTSGLSELKVLMWQWGCACVCAQSCPTLCNPVDCSPLGSSVHGIFQARILNWVAISFFRGSSWPRNWTSVSCVSCIDRCVLYQLSHQGSPHMPVEQTFKNFMYIH